MKNYLLSYSYCFLYLAISSLGFWGLSTFLETQTYHTVLMTCLTLCLGMSFFLSIWFRQDELFFLLFLTLLTYLFLSYLLPISNGTSFYQLIAFPLICLLYPINVYFLFHTGSGDSFFYSFGKKLFVLTCQIAFIYFFTYFLPVLFGTPFLLAFEIQLNKILQYSFGLPSTIPLMSIFIFIISLGLLALKKVNKMEQIQACVLTLFSITFISFLLTSHPFLFHLCFVSSVSCVLFSLLQISHKMAFLDELTNIPGRRALMSQLKQIEAENYTLAMIDIDHFKKLNDTYGHEIGDQALRTIASTLSQHINSGTLYRYGGEEFVLLFPHKQLDDILDEMENNRVLVSNSDFFLCPPNVNKQKKNQPYMASVHITLSCGVSQKQPLQSYEEVINVADQALYKAKQTGRNKTVYNKNGKFFELF